MEIFLFHPNKDDLLDMLIVLLSILLCNTYIEFGTEASIIIIQDLKKQNMVGCHVKLKTNNKLYFQYYYVIVILSLVQRHL